MAVYAVDAGGKAPNYAAAGDYILTNGGTYLINSGSNGNYQSTRVADWTPATYGGQYGAITQAPSTLINAGQGASVTNYGQGRLTYDPDTGTITRDMGNGKAYYVNPGQEKYQSIYDEYTQTYGSPINRTATTDQAIAAIQNLDIPAYVAPDTSQYDARLQQALDNLQTPYTPVDVNSYMNNVMTMDEALEQARMLLDPTYQQAREQALNSAYANLERAGLYDSVYGQNLAMAAEQQVTAQQQQAINDLALSLVNQDREQAMRLLQYAINENQYGASYRQEGLSTVADASLNAIRNIISLGQMQNDYLLQATGLKLQQEAEIIDAQYKAGQITSTQLENELLRLQIQAEQAELQAMQSGGYGSSGGSYSSGGGGYTGLVDDDGPTGMPYDLAHEQRIMDSAQYMRDYNAARDSNYLTPEQKADSLATIRENARLAGIIR